MRALPALLLSLLLAAQIGGQETPLRNAYERPKNGPPLTNVLHKAERSWLWAKVRNPKHHPSARMPEFGFTDDEASDILAYLDSVSDPSSPGIEWPAWANKRFEEMNDDEATEMLDLVDRGKAVWGNARCTVCHVVNGPGGKLIGGFVDLRVGGMDLQIAAAKLKRDWLFRWIKDPKTYFPDTLMPRYRLSDEEIRALVEYILRDDAFQSPAGTPSDRPPGDPSRGKRLMEVSRCVVCHEVRGIPEVLSLSERRVPPQGNTMDWIAHDVRCLSCHTIEGRGGTYAPDLTNVGSRLQADWVREFVQRPDLVRPLSQQMPKFNLSEEEAKAVVEYITTRRIDSRIPAEIPGGPVNERDVEQGREAFRSRGCAACHSTGEGPGGAVGPSLLSVATRLRPGYIWYHLKNPHSVNPYSAEPDYGLSDEEARFLAAYLSTKKGK